MRGPASALAIWLAATAAARAATVRIEIEPPEITVGDRARATLIVQGAPGELAEAPRFPVWEKTWGEVEIVAAEPPVESAGAYRQTLTIAAFRTGDIPLPSKAVALPGGAELRTPADVALHVKSVLPAAERDPKPAPPAPPRALPWGRRFWWTLTGAASLALAAAAALFWRRRSSAAEQAGRPGLSPIEELEARLAALESGDGEASAERQHTALSLALRRYLGRTLDFPAAESTTSEIQRQLRGRHLPADLAQRTARLLRECDAVKFARGEATRPEFAARVGAAREIGHGIDRHLAPPPELEATA